MERRDIPISLLRLVARAQFRQSARHESEIPEPSWIWLDEASRLVEALDTEGLEVRPKSLGADMIASEEGA